MTFDLGCPAGDAAWAPHSATVFAAAGEDGKVRACDLTLTLACAAQHMQIPVIITHASVHRVHRDNCMPPCTPPFHHRLLAVVAVRCKTSWSLCHTDCT